MTQTDYQKHIALAQQIAVMQLACLAVIKRVK